LLIAGIPEDYRCTPFADGLGGFEDTEVTTCR
jgi:hypothetical protein